MGIWNNLHILHCPVKLKGTKGSHNQKTSPNDVAPKSICGGIYMHIPTGTYLDSLVVPDLYVAQIDSALITKI